MLPKGTAFDRLKEHCQDLKTDDVAGFDRYEALNIDALKPQITWGTTPAMTIDIDQTVPGPKDAEREACVDVYGAAAWRRHG